MEQAPDTAAVHAGLSAPYAPMRHAVLAAMAERETACAVPLARDGAGAGRIVAALRRRGQRVEVHGIYEAPGERLIPLPCVESMFDLETPWGAVADADTITAMLLSAAAMRCNWRE